MGFFTGVVVRTDHRALQWLHSFKHPEGQIARWLQTLAEYPPECEAAFQTLKHCLSQAPILSFPRFDHQFIVDADASGRGLGAVLSQVVDGKEQVVAYASRVLTKAERQYAATRRELFANMRELHFSSHWKRSVLLLNFPHNPVPQSCPQLPCQQPKRK